MILTVLLTVVHVVVALFLIAVVLLQTGKRADLAGAFGGGGSQTAFGTRGAATLLSKATTASAVIFMATSLALSILATTGSSETGGSVLPDEPPPAETRTAPAVPPAEDSKPAQDVPPAEQAPGSDAPAGGTDGGGSETAPTSEPPVNPN